MKKIWLLAMACLLLLFSACGERGNNRPADIDCEDARIEIQNDRDGADYSPGEMVVKAAAELGDEPPALFVACGSGETAAMQTSYTWAVKDAAGNSESIIACGLHPLDSQKYVTPMERDGAEKIALHFEVQPDGVSARYWTDAHWGDAAAYEDDFETADCTGGEIALPKDTSVGYIFEVQASWNEAGSASYVFYIAPQTESGTNP